MRNNCLYCSFYYGRGVYSEIADAAVLFELVRLAYLSEWPEWMMRERIIVTEVMTLHIASLWQIAHSGRDHFAS